MTVWYTVNLGDAMLAMEPLGHIEELFLSEYAKAGRPKDMAVFIRHESPGDLHCELFVYFTPASSVLAGAVDAEPCDRPSPESLSLLAGGEESWKILFSECEQ